MPTKKDADHAYDINRLNMFFAISSIIMFAFFAWMMWADFSRDWKHYQAEFRKLERLRTAAQETQEEETLAASPEYQKVQQELQAAEAELKSRKADYQKALADQAKMQGEWYRADQAFRFTKAEYEARRYDYESAVAEHPKDAPNQKEKLDKIQGRMKDLSAKLDEVNARKAVVDGNVAAFTKSIDDLEKENTKIRTKADRLKRKEVTLAKNVANIFRNLPMVDFIGPNIKIQQVVINNQFEDLNFIRIPRVDRCMTCHIPIAQDGYKEGEVIPGYKKPLGQPFVTHPNLKLFVGSDSKHPMESFGCTGCHMGRGRATDFITTVHMPANEEEKTRWEKEYNWEQMHHWDYPMYTKDMVEASCVKCHQGAAMIPQGDKINVARMLFIDYGCHGCHLTKGFENLPKVGPDLRHISSKVTKEWAFKWIKNPKGFRPTTRMPRYFGNDNNNSPEDIDRSNVEVRAAVEYLFAHSQKIDYAPLTLSGDPANGQSLVRELGCVGCHLTHDEKPASFTTRRRFGPALDKLGSKTNADWLFHWLKEPRHYAPLTRMPNMKLSDQEAMDIASYLLSLRDPAWEGQKVPQLKEEYLKEEILFHLKRTYGLQAEAEYNKMSEQDRWTFLGEKTISRYGCSGCHLIEGFETAKGIGTSLSEEGSKKLTKFDFGFVEIEHSVPAYVKQKLLNPRIYDKDRVKRWDEKLMMPNFQFTDEEASAITMLIMGLTNEKVPAEAQKVLTAREELAEKGRWLVIQKNCIACHNIDGWGGEIAGVIKEQGMAPPALYSEGEKVQADWLFSFLKAPGHIRPWLHVRMPLFRLTDEEANTLVQFFLASAQRGPFDTQPDVQVNHVEGESLFNTYRCALCHVLGGVVPEGKTSAELAPDLTMASSRLRAEWVLKWLDNPQAYQPGTRMPDFFPEAALPTVLNGDAELQKAAIRNYIFSLGRGPQASILTPAEAAWQGPAPQDAAASHAPATGSK